MPFPAGPYPDSGALKDKTIMLLPRDILHHYCIKPRKSLGQCFLVDQDRMAQIVQLADAKKDDVVVEIGAGIGVLTQSLAERAARVIAVELDDELVKVLEERLQPFPNIDIHHGNILRFDFRSLFGRTHRKIKVVGNIPYNITSPLLFYLLSCRDVIHDFVLMMQKEMVERLTASPGEKAYGVPSVILQMFADMENVLTIPPSCFYPRPKVESAVLKGAFGDQPLFAIQDEDFFIRLVRDAFGQRRKTLMNNLKQASWMQKDEALLKDILKEAAIDGQRRGETLSVKEFAVLSNIIKNKIIMT